MSLGPGGLRSGGDIAVEIQNDAKIASHSDSGVLLFTVTDGTYIWFNHNNGNYPRYDRMHPAPGGFPPAYTPLHPAKKSGGGFEICVASGGSEDCRPGVYEGRFTTSRWTGYKSIEILKIIMMRRILPFILLLLALTAKAQQKLSYAYDGAGNRIERTIVMALSSADSADGTWNALFFEEQIAGKQLKIYPNPVREQIAIQIPGYEYSSQGEFVLLDISGSMLHRGAIDSEVTLVNMSRFATGTYVLHIIDGDERTVWKIIKQ